METQSTKRYLVKRPRALQWFHHGELQFGSEEERQAGRFELFLDLLYVALVANFADNLTEDVTGPQFLKYLLIFTPAWHAWADIKELCNSYYTDDLAQRVLTLWLMALLVLYGNNAPLVDVEIAALRTTVAVYLLARLTTISTYAIYSFASPYHRTQTRFYSSLTAVGLLIWIPMFFEGISLRAKVAVAVVAILYEEAVWVFSFGPWLKKWLKLKYSTAVNIPHEVDRAAAFYIIILGEFLYQIIVSSPAAIGLNFAAMRAIWTLVIAFCLNWLYVNVDGSIDLVHPLRRAIWSAIIWMLIHLPLAASLLIAGHVSAVSVKEEDLNTGERWLWGGGLGVGLFVLWIIALCFDSRDDPRRLMLPKQIRMLGRPIVALILALLPLTTSEQLNSNKLLSIGAGLFVLLLIWETVTSLERGACTFEKWYDEKVDDLSLPSTEQGQSELAEK